MKKLKSLNKIDYFLLVFKKMKKIFYKEDINIILWLIIIVI